MDFNKLAHRLRTQDNAGSAHPIFCVQKQVETYGINPNYHHDGSVLIHDGEPISEDTLSEYDLTEDDCERVFYAYHWETVTSHFTRDAAEAYQAQNFYRLGKSRIFVESQHRAWEWNDVVEMLKAATWFEPPSEAVVKEHFQKHGGSWLARLDLPSSKSKHRPVVMCLTGNAYDDAREIGLRPDEFLWRPISRDGIPVYYSAMIPADSP